MDNSYPCDEYLFLPTSVFVSSSGDVYVSDRDGHRVIRYNKDLKCKLFSGIVFDASNKDAYNAWNNKYQIYEEGLIDFNHGYNTGFSDWMMGSEDTFELVYRSNELNDLIYPFMAVDNARHLVPGWGSGLENGRFTSPESIAVDSSGNICVLDTGNNRIQKFASDGSFVSKFGQDVLISPKGIDVDSYGNIWVADTGNHRIVQFGPTGNFIREYKSEEYEITPQKIKIRDNKLYIADANFDEPLVWNIGGEISYLSPSDNWLSPNNDGVKDNIQLFYNLSQSADVSIQIEPKTEPGLSAMGLSTNYALNNEPRAIGSNTDVWDGKSVPLHSYGEGGPSPAATVGEVVPDGPYTIKMIASFGDLKKSKTIEVTVDTEAPFLELSLSPSIISPNSDTVQDDLYIDYYVIDEYSAKSEVQLLLKKNDSVVDVLQDYTTSATGENNGFVWDGKISDTVIEGQYDLCLSVIDQAGNTAVETQEVIVDVQGPQITSVNLSNSYFSPNGDGNKDSTEISFNLYDTYSDKAYVTVQIEDEYGMLITEIVKREELSLGDHSFTWDGFSPRPLVPSSVEGLGEGLGVRAEDGSYTVKIYAEDMAYNLGSSEPQIVVVDTIPPDIINFTSVPNPFFPNNDGIKDKTTFSYLLSEPCDTELKIMRDDEITLFRNYYNSNITEESFFWDGSGARGEILGQAHPYFLIAEDRAGNITTSETNIIVVNHEPSLVPYVFAAPDPFSPVNPDNNFTDIKYYLSRDGLTVDVAVLGKGGRIVKQLVSSEVQDKGEHSVRWQGDFSSSYDGPHASQDSSKIADGSWQIQVSAATSDETKPAVVSNTVLVDNVPPHIIIGPVEVDQVKKTATLKYSVPENVLVEVKVFDERDSLVEVLESTVKKEAGDHILTWTPVTVSNELTYIKISAIDSALNQSVSQTDLFSISPIDDLQIVNLSATPNPFTPNGDGLHDLSRISYKVQGGAPDYTVDIDIQTPSGSTVKTLIEDEPQSKGTYSFYWDGLNEAGKLTSDGYYEYVITLKDKLGSNVEQRGSIVVVSTRPSLDLSVSPSIFSPNADNSKDTVAVNYSIDYPDEYISGEALVKLEVLNATGEAVWDKIFSHTPGSYAYEYKGLDASGNPLLAGEYNLKISAEDALKTTAIPKTVTLEVDYDEPTLAISSINPNPFSPYINGENDQVVISYTLAKPASVTVKIKQLTTEIKTLQAEQWTEAYIAGSSATGIKAFAIPTITWDGKNEVGDYVEDGNYSIEISALDSAGNSSITSQIVEVDNSVPMDPVLVSLPQYTNQNAQYVVGTAESGSRVDVYINSTLVAKGTVESDGSFDIPISLNLGLNTIKTRSQDIAGNYSEYSASQTVTYETDAPVVSNFSVAPNPAKVGLVTLTFESSETLKINPIVKLNANEVIFDQKNNLTYTYTYEIAEDDDQGPSTITIEMIDLANNQTTYLPADEAGQPIHPLTIDTLSPDKPTLSLLPSYTNQQDIVASGEAEAGSALKINNNNVVVKEIVVVDDGEFSTQIELNIGDNEIYVILQDQAGNFSPSSDSQTVNFDTVNPVFSNVSVNPNPARLGPATITFDVSKTLEANPQVTVNGNSASFISLDVFSYTYQYDVNEVNYQDTAIISIEGKDLAGNRGIKTSEFIIDTVNPVVSNLAVDPVRAKAGIVNISFDLSEELKQNPQVLINGNLATYNSKVDNSYTYSYNVTTADQQGQANITIETTDQANNTSVYSFSDSLIVDTIPPAITTFEVQPTLAREETVTITFAISETLESKPIVKVNDNLASFYSLSDSNYTYTYDVPADEQQGPANIIIEMIDLANNPTTYLPADEAGQPIHPLTIDTIFPSITNLDVTPQYAKLGSTVIIDFSVSEELLNDPAVSLSRNATLQSKTVYSPDRIDYSYLYTVDDNDPEGLTTISIEVIDLADNQTTYLPADEAGQPNNLLTIDKTFPQATNIIITPNPASTPDVSGSVKIKFNVSEPLNQSPTVFVTQNGATPQMATVSGSWSSTGGQCEASYDVFTGNDGSALITIEVIDLANNLSTYLPADEAGQPINPLTVDTINPSFSNLQTEVSANPDFSKFAREGSEATIRFDVSEPLNFNPEVKVNGNSADYVSLVSNQYVYKYGVSSSDINGNAVVSVSGFDPAGNEGAYETSSSAESFVIDIINPTVAIASPETEMIANPSPFSTNGSSDTNYRQTSLQYQISEYGYVTVSIHKVSNTKETYVKDDFNESNKVASFSEGWLTAGVHSRYWNGVIQFNQSTYDLNSNGFADPGKYAFIVEVKDRAGNLIEGKWGGTCWIQDNVLDLVMPDQAEVGDNPQPRYFSPNGDGNLDETKIWFRVNLGVSPAEPLRPERIGVMALPDDLKWLTDVIKVVGSYTVRVWNENKTNLVRTIVQDAPLNSNITIYETWDGKDDAGSYVADGNYLIEVDARDFIGGQAEHNFLTFTVTVDNNAPRVVSNEPDLANTPWSNTPKTYNVDFFDDHNTFASSLEYAQYKITTAPDQGGSIVENWHNIFSSNLNANSYTTNWGLGIFAQCGQGTFYVSVQAFDNAGNETIVNDVFYVKKDTEAPVSPSFAINGVNVYVNTRQVSISASATDSLSGVSEVWLRNDGGGYQKFTSNPWILNDIDGDRHVYVKFKDVAGNWTKDDVSFDQIILDRQSPYISAFPSVVDDNFNPYVEGITTINFTANDQGGSGIAQLSAKIKYGEAVVKDLNITGSSDTKSVEWDGKNDPGNYVNEGNYTLEISAVDNANNPATIKETLIYLRDNQRIVFGRDGSPDNPSVRINANYGMDIVWQESGGQQCFGKSFPQEYAVNVMSASILPDNYFYPYLAAHDNDYFYDIRVEEGNVFCRRHLSSTQQLLGTAQVSFTGNASKASICEFADTNHNVYIVWVEDVDQSKEIFFQKIPFNFAPINGGITAASVIAAPISFASSLEAPVLLTPEDDATVSSIRPLLKWSHEKGTTQNYKVELSKNDSFTIGCQEFIKSADTGSVDKDNPNLYYYTYQIHEFDPGLEIDQYYWRVTAHTTDESITSEARSFTIAPKLTLTNVTNYPNPFNPNHLNPNNRTTKIRYRLGADADDVKIRIYDIAGALVVDIPHCPIDGEGSSVWDKYNDVEWDGRNGRGDVVMNGIYPFEVTARLGNKSVSARGKIAVLK